MNNQMNEISEMFDRTYYRVYQRRCKTMGVVWRVSEVSLLTACMIKKQGSESYFYLTREAAMQKCEELIGQNKGEENGK